MTSEEEYNNMLERSRRFLISAERNLQEGFIDVGAFSANQSLELFLKAMLLKELGDYPQVTISVNHVNIHLWKLSPV